MKTTRVRVLGSLITSASTAAMIFILQVPFVRAQPSPRSGKSLAQKLVEEAHAKHPETDEIGISTTTSRGCVGIASTDRSDIGEKCEKEDLDAMHTGKPVTEKEKDGFDVSLPLHDSSGKPVGSIGIEFKLSAGQSEASVVKQAQGIAREMEAQIPSKASLFTQSR